RTERADELDIPGPRDGRHVRAERLRDLDRERTDAATGAVHEHALPGLDLGDVPKSLQRGAAGDADGRGLLEREGRRLRHDPVLARPRDLGEGGDGAPE